MQYVILIPSSTPIYISAFPAPPPQKNKKKTKTSNGVFEVLCLLPEEHCRDLPSRLRDTTNGKGQAAACRYFSLFNKVSRYL